MRPFWVEMGCHLKREILSKEFAVEKQLSNYLSILIFPDKFVFSKLVSYKSVCLAQPKPNSTVRNLISSR